MSVFVCKLHFWWRQIWRHLHVTILQCGAKFSNVLVHWRIRMIRAKNYETVPKFVKVMARILWPLFFPDTVYIFVIPDLEMHACDWSKSRHVTYTKSIYCHHKTLLPSWIFMSVNIAFIIPNYSWNHLTDKSKSQFFASYVYLSSKYRITFLILSIFLTAFENIYILRNIWLTQANPNHRYIIPWVRDIIELFAVLFTKFYFFILLWGTTKQIETGVIGHYWKLFPLSWGNIAWCWRRMAIFPQIRGNNF